MNVYIGLIRESGLMCTLLLYIIKLFLLPNKPIQALKMRCNLLQFDKVLIIKIKIKIKILNAGLVIFKNVHHYH